MPWQLCKKVSPRGIEAGFHSAKMRQRLQWVVLVLCVAHTCRSEYVKCQSCHHHDEPLNVQSNCQFFDHNSPTAVFKIAGTDHRSFVGAPFADEFGIYNVVYQRYGPDSRPYLDDWVRTLHPQVPADFGELNVEFVPLQPNTWYRFPTEPPFATLNCEGRIAKLVYADSIADLTLDTRKKNPDQFIPATDNIEWFFRHNYNNGNLLVYCTSVERHERCNGIEFVREKLSLSADSFMVFPPYNDGEKVKYKRPAYLKFVTNIDDTSRTVKFEYTDRGVALIERLRRQFGSLNRVDPGSGMWQPYSDYSIWLLENFPVKELQVDRRELTPTRTDFVAKQPNAPPPMKSVHSKFFPFVLPTLPPVPPQPVRPRAVPPNPAARRMPGPPRAIDKRDEHKVPPMFRRRRPQPRRGAGPAAAAPDSDSDSDSDSE